MTAPSVLRPEQAVELAHILEFVHDWLADNTDNAALQASWIRFSFGLVSLGELRCDIARYACLLGSDIDRLENHP